jgi:Sugar transferases involved in lipopolysaccharide synthesis|tara:strand:+ start:290 stop:883 length:594 start_codon:yes stop_codon:yes gene_type:complete
MKRLIDISISSGLLLIFFPLLLLISLANIFFHNGKIFFIQDRAGYNGNVFKIIKFKTMNDNADKKGELLPDGERLTIFGRILRFSSLDELPTLWNVLAGQMSLVGPRPLLVSYLDRYNEYQLRRLEVKPGLTGWAQVNGRNSISWEKKFEYDVWYVDNRSFKLDLIIIVKTIGQVITGKGISHKNHPTMEEFMGTNK